MSRPLLNWGNLFYVPFALLPLLLGRVVAVPTLLGVVVGAALAYRTGRMPRAIQLMIPGFIGGVISTLTLTRVGLRFWNTLPPSLWQAVWWSAWFAFFVSPLIISVVLVRRGATRGGQ